MTQHNINRNIFHRYGFCIRDNFALIYFMPLVRTKHDDQFVIFLLYVVIGQETQSLERKKLSYVLEYVLIRIVNKMDWFPK